LKDISNRTGITFCGEIMFSWDRLYYEIKKKSIENSNIICIGNLGLDFRSIEDIKSLTAKIGAKLLREGNNALYSPRGGADEPSLFTEKNSEIISSEGFNLIPDYGTIKHKERIIQFIGGNVQPDRLEFLCGNSSKKRMAYFEQEKCVKSWAVVTTGAPTKRFFESSIYDKNKSYRIKKDPNLLLDLKLEESVIEKILSVCQPDIHAYGIIDQNTITKTTISKKSIPLNLTELYQYEANS
jgi:hypothetical protein